MIDIARVSAALAAAHDTTTVRHVAAEIGCATDKPTLSLIARAMKRAGWRRGAQIAGSKGSYTWWPPEKR